MVPSDAVSKIGFEAVMKIVVAFAKRQKCHH
jgi:hypothetical protein